MTTLREKIQSTPSLRDLAINADPQNPQGVWEQIANDPTLTTSVVGVVSRVEFVKWAVWSGVRGKIDDLSKTANHPLRDSALAIMDVINGVSGGIDFSEQANEMLLLVWENAGMISGAQRDALISLATINSNPSALEVVQAVFNDDGTKAIV